MKLGKKNIRKKFSFTKSLSGDDKIILEFLEILFKQRLILQALSESFHIQLRVNYISKIFFSIQ